MSETFDVDVLVHATHRASPFHDKAKTLVERFLAPTWDDDERAAGYAGWRKAVQRTLDWVDVS